MATLECAHCYHAECLDMWTSHHVAVGTQASCPQCRGALQEAHRRPREEDSVAEEHNIGTPDSQVSQGSFATARTTASVMPWWPRQE